ncbi:protein vreteno [Lucilia sericata]|uniref:protein vreteno n=1 Tax=Lucilia sericata TaxID=13632 RepID=UPI0018A87719|nr:protein vreteno [Lucilia sericata]XP_037806951.1 protein vreteno [Lucilia sericata]
MTNNSAVEKHDFAAAAASNFDELALNDTGYCNLCGEKAESKCDRCGDFYCSEFCQRRDWQNHRYICFPMPKLVKTRRQCSSSKTEIAREESQPQTIVNNELKVQQNSNLPPHGSCVLLTGFKSSNRCFIRSTNPSTLAENKRVLNEIHEFGKKSGAFSENPKTNAYALALKEDKWCRVQILGGRKENYYRIRFMDFGEISKRYLKDLRRVSRAIINLPCFNSVVQLKDIVNFSSDLKLLESLTKYTNMEYRVEFVEPDEAGGNVKLYNWQNNTLLNSLILESMSNLKSDKDMELVSTTSSLSNSNEVQNNGFEKPVMNGNSNKKDSEKNSSTAENNTESVVSHSIVNPAAKKKPAVSPRQIQMHKPCLQPPFEIIPLNEKDRNCKIIIVDDSYTGSGYIGCLLNKNCENLNDISKFLQEYKVSDQSYKPKINEYCLAMFENDWYRAKVVEIISEDKFLVVYIDFTNEMELPSKLIRRYPMSLTLPCYTTLCALDGLPEDISDELKDFLEQNCKSFTHLNIENIRSVDGVCYVESKELLNKMRNAKLL